jgi:hypothetical protein
VWIAFFLAISLNSLFAADTKINDHVSDHNYALVHKKGAMTVYPNSIEIGTVFTRKDVSGTSTKILYDYWDETSWHTDENVRDVEEYGATKPVIIGDGEGGYYVCWIDYRSTDKGQIYFDYNKPPTRYWDTDIFVYEPEGSNGSLVNVSIAINDSKDVLIIYDEKYLTDDGTIYRLSGRVSHSGNYETWTGPPQLVTSSAIPMEPSVIASENNFTVIYRTSTTHLTMGIWSVEVPPDIDEETDMFYPERVSPMLNFDEASAPAIEYIPLDEGTGDSGVYYAVFCGVPFNETQYNLYLNRKLTNDPGWTEDPDPIIEGHPDKFYPSLDPIRMGGGNEFIFVGYQKYVTEHSKDHIFGIMVKRMTDGSYNISRGPEQISESDNKHNFCEVFILDPSTRTGGAIFQQYSDTWVEWNEVTN